MPIVLVLGATGIIGNEVASQFIRKGYEVFGLARTEEKANQLRRVEIQPILANAQETNKWIDVAKKADIIIEAIADYSNNDVQFAVFEALSTIAKERPSVVIIYTNGVWMYGNNNGQLITENQPMINSNVILAPRIELGKQYSKLGAITILPSLVYGGSGAHSGGYFRAIETGEITLYGAGQYQTYIHYIDIAAMYIAAAERANELRGEIFIAGAYVDKVEDIVQGIAKALGKTVKVTHVQPADPYQECLALNQRASNAKAQIKLNWRPTQLSLIDGAKKYYEAWKILAPAATNYKY
ncbi:hypothetical protein SAMD00019534_063220 [Acytostelium subglobosum LB1]|uniref:hypothetical protein n=1 Tax=Acytostelium subglobosum LB1 TaxID=1410327 RepID=UPI000644D990|nr:hypothetical protein SAMD00019534_063220 [Acytostelium subglobosum LB1]GAM23147.1 hypothetical protein SAMD00019534_063220 [Acytostelium subglobosum LB1]|eukprot:XP_012753596.1 hypothetical protein SAMD00019534_063220 [Acytostelium subglobosum LB1]